MSESDLAFLATGSQLGPYQVLSLLGTGGMGQVYKAFDARLCRDVAIKVSEEQFSQRFDREVRAVAALNHPNICTVHDVGPNYLVMELIEGETLRQWLRRGLPLERKLLIARQVLEALGAAHRTGVVHRDLKPENVMVRADGYVKVLDFGLAKWLPTTPRGQSAQAVTQTGQILGTVTYMSPEQIEGVDVDQRSDLFAFGILLYEMLANRHPWPRPSSVAVLHAILTDDPPPIDDPLVSEDLSRIVQTLLRKHPVERYPHAEAVLDALAASSPVHESSTANRPSPKLLTSVAVLPFVVLNDMHDSRALSLGFADALITIFGSLEDVVVAPTSAILKYVAADTEPAQVCRDLGVRHALQGTVQKLGSHWRVSIQLFDATTHKVTLSEKHDFDLDNVFEVQDEIGRRVMESLQSRFSSALPISRDRYSSDPEAYGEFMAGLRESYSDQPETLRSAAAHLSSAVERDPEFALAHAWLANVSMQIHFYIDTQRTWLERAEYHCARAIALDPLLPEGHWGRSAILWSPAKNFQHAEAIAALERVLAVRPNFDRAHNRMAAICLHIGRFDEARIAHAQAQRSNPKNRSYNLEYIHLYSGDFARAEAAVAVWLRESPGHLHASCYAPVPPLMTGQLALAGQRIATGLELHPAEPMLLSLQGILHARRNETGAALESVRKSLDLPITVGHAHHTYYQVACVYAVLGETERAMAWLERAADTGYPCWPFFRLDPHLENLRNESAFQRLVADLEKTYSAIRIQRL